MDDPLDVEGPSSSTVRKGKCRAIEDASTERTPLLVSSQPPLIQDLDDTSTRRRRPLLLLLLTVFISTLGLCLIVALALVAIAYSYNSKITGTVRDEVLTRAVVIHGPDRVDVLNATEGSMWLQVDMRVGVDAGTAIDIIIMSQKGEDANSGVITGFRRMIARWAVGRMGTVTARSDSVILASEGMNIANLTIPSVTLPLTLERDSDASWLTHLSLPVQVRVTENAADLKEIAERGWRNGVVPMSATIKGIYINGGSRHESSWRRRLNFDQSSLTMRARFPIPELPGLPAPGRGTPFPGLSDLLTLEKFKIINEDHRISIRASANVVDPLPESFTMDVPAFPFFVSLTGSNMSVEVVTGFTEKFSLTHPNVSIHLTAAVSSLPRSAAPLLSAFISDYLGGNDAPIVVGSPLFPNIEVPAVFPAPHPKPKILRDVHIREMHIVLKGESVLASGTIFAHVVLPPGVNILVDAQKIWPDVLVFDGEVPDEGGGGNKLTTSSSPLPYPLSVDGFDFPPAHKGNRSRKPKDGKKKDTIPKDPLPSPLPDRAFARIRPDDWLPSRSERINGTNAYEVYAEVKDVPLEVLPGRDSLLRSFITKVLFSGRDGALAGVKGTAAVGAAVDGLPVDDEEGEHVFELTGLPFSGSVRIGKKSL